MVEFTYLTFCKLDWPGLTAIRNSKNRELLEECLNSNWNFSNDNLFIHEWIWAFDGYEGWDAAGELARFGLGHEVEEFVEESLADWIMGNEPISPFGHRIAAELLIRKFGTVTLFDETSIITNNYTLYAEDEEILEVVKGMAADKLHELFRDDSQNDFSPFPLQIYGPGITVIRSHEIEKFRHDLESAIAEIDEESDLAHDLNTILGSIPSWLQQHEAVIILCTGRLYDSPKKRPGWPHCSWVG
ncbi:MAG: hypothetical protein H6581_00045 [Bacteroidia bacterium]|nr:hypothetical protein [Bacteroidia bacterium]